MSAMRDSESRTAVLLGAGPPADAGLPLTSEFAEQLVRAMQTDKRTDYSITDAMLNALHFVYSVMIGHQGEDGRDPLVAVNVETMF